MTTFLWFDNQAEEALNFYVSETAAPGFYRLSANEQVSMREGSLRLTE